MHRRPTQAVEDRLYRQYYNRIVDILKTGADFKIRDYYYDDDAFRQVMGDSFDYGYKRGICYNAYRDVKQDEYPLAVKHHPTWYKAVCSGEGWTACLRAWRADGGMEYLKHMKYKEVR